MDADAPQSYFLLRFLLRYILPLLIALPVGFLLLYPQLWRCMQIEGSPDFLGLTGQPNVYVNRNATRKQAAQLNTHLQTARTRLARFWGDRRGRATLIYCPQQADYEQYCIGGEGAGCSLGTPWGESFLVLGPDGNNADVIAHELCHDELFARLGWWRTKREIPVWFNEGLALMVDYRFSPPDLWEHPDRTARPNYFDTDDDMMAFAQPPMLKLTNLETTREFFGGGYEHVMLAYQIAANEVSTWLRVVGRAGVPVLAGTVASGADFEETYRQLERNKRLKNRRR